jgi:hypothetical protein
VYVIINKSMFYFLFARLVLLNKGIHFHMHSYYHGPLILNYLNEINVGKIL